MGCKSANQLDRLALSERLQIYDLHAGQGETLPAGEQQGTAVGRDEWTDLRRISCVISQDQHTLAVQHRLVVRL